MRKSTRSWRERLRPVHRWLGVGLGVYFLAMAGSGILLNHPDLLAGTDLPRSWLPGDYDYRDWNRGSLRGAVPDPGGGWLLCGDAGVWRLDPGAAAPRGDSAGLPPGVYRRDTRALLAVDGPEPFLLAGTRGGLFGRRRGDPGPWQPVPLPDGSPPVVDLLTADGRVLVLTRDRVYAANPVWPPRFVDATPPRAPEPGGRLPLFRLVFHLHSGETWGLPGRLAVDAIGLLLGFLGASGLWFWGRRRRGSLARGLGGRLARGGLRWHRRLGLWGALPLLFVALTGLFQRPPFLVAIAGATYPASAHPAPADPNPWHDLLRKALWDPARRVLVLATADGIYEGPADGARPFTPVAGAPPVSVMGATVFRPTGDGAYWVGSMSGLFRWDRDLGAAWDAFTGQPPRPGARGPVGAQQVVGFVDFGGRWAAADYGLGLLGAWAGGPPPALPPELQDGGRISLWHALFEFHNGRLFGFLLGPWAWIAVPLGGLALLAAGLSGLGRGGGRLGGRRRR